jgi:amino acid transporter
LVLFVIAAASPMGYSLGSIPIMIARGGASGAAGSFFVASASLMIFSVGYVAMAARMRRVGGLNIFVTEGLGIILGGGVSYVALLVYATATIGSIGMFGTFCETAVRSIVGVDLPWYLWSFALMGVVAVLGTRNIEFNAHVLGISITLELGILLLLATAIFVGAKPEPVSLQPLSIFGGRDSYFGIHMTLAICAFAGFESTVLYSSEARDGSRNVRNATFVSVAVMGVAYAIITTQIINGLGISRVREIASASPDTMFFIAAGQYLGRWSVSVMEVLVVNSWFAAVLALHNVTARYIASLSRESLLPGWASRVHPNYRSPWNASLLFSGVSILSIALCALFKADPFWHVYTIGTAPVLVGLPFMEVLASLATIAFFRKFPSGLSVWVRWVAPLAAAVVIGTINIAVVAQMSIFTAQRGLINVLISCSILVAMIVGMLCGVRVRAARRLRLSQDAESCSC